MKRLFELPRQRLERVTGASSLVAQVLRPDLVRVAIALLVVGVLVIGLWAGSSISAFMEWYVSRF